jgi:hypothetical protein
MPKDSQSPGALLATTHDANGLRVRLRLARPSDALRVSAFLERHQPDLAGQAQRFTLYDPRERIVLAATAPIDGSERIVGLADLRPMDDETLVVVVDDAPPAEAVRDLLAEASLVVGERVRRAA